MGSFMLYPASIFTNLTSDPLCPLLFSLVLNVLVAEVSSDAHLMYHAWYIDDGIMAGASIEV